MKKKIKDLTIEEIKKICSNNICDSCPLDTNKHWCKYDDLKCYGNEEIEVDENEGKEINNN